MTASLSPLLWLGIFIKRAYTLNSRKRWKCLVRKYIVWLSISLINMEQIVNRPLTKYKDHLVQRGTSV